MEFPQQAPSVAETNVAEVFLFPSQIKIEVAAAV
jgi:hypothetical protein